MSDTPSSMLPSLALITPNDLIELALKEVGVLGVGQTAVAEDVTDCFKRLNMMLAQWSEKRWLVWHLLDHGLVSTGAQSYTVGVGGDFDIPYPSRIIDAYVRQFGQSGQPYEVDYPLVQLEAREDYSRIALKGLTSFPRWFFYDSDYPLGRVYFWPIPMPTIYEPHIVVRAQLQQFASLTTPIALPPLYQEALYANLALRLAPMFGNDVSPVTAAVAKASLETVRGANVQTPRLMMPAHLMRGSLYSILDDQTY